MKTVSLLRKLRHRGGERVDWVMTFTAALYHMVRMRSLLTGSLSSLGQNDHPAGAQRCEDQPAVRGEMTRCCRSLE